MFYLRLGSNCYFFKLVSTCRLQTFFFLSICLTSFLTNNRMHVWVIRCSKHVELSTQHFCATTKISYIIRFHGSKNLCCSYSYYVILLLFFCLYRHSNVHINAKKKYVLFLLLLLLLIYSTFIVCACIYFSLSRRTLHLWLLFRYSKVI